MGIPHGLLSLYYIKEIYGLTKFHFITNTRRLRSPFTITIGFQRSWKSHLSAGATTSAIEYRRISILDSYLLVQAYQSLWLVAPHDIYQWFTCVDHASTFCWGPIIVLLRWIFCSSSRPHWDSRSLSLPHGLENRSFRPRLHCPRRSLFSRVEWQMAEHLVSPG
jgi:hypothetical protein